MTHLFRNKAKRQSKLRAYQPNQAVSKWNTWSWQSNSVQSTNLSYDGPYGPNYCFALSKNAEAWDWRSWFRHWCGPPIYNAYEKPYSPTHTKTKNT